MEYMVSKSIVTGYFTVGRSKNANLYKYNVSDVA